jgi:hypothetical protein
MTRIAGVASAFPRHYYRQQEVASALKRHWGKGLENPEVLDRLLTRVGVDGRYFALPIEAYDDLTTWGKSCRRRLISATPSTDGRRPVREERQNHLGLTTTPAYRGSHGLPVVPDGRRL